MQLSRQPCTLVRPKGQNDTRDTAKPARGAVRCCVAQCDNIDNKHKDEQQHKNNNNKNTRRQIGR